MEDNKQSPEKGSGAIVESESECWSRFVKTGSIGDYLHFSGIRSKNRKASSKAAKR